MITAKQSEHLERQQTQALRNIFGQAISAKKMRDKANLPLLSSRRRAACLSFATRNLANPRCRDWFIGAKICRKGWNAIQKIQRTDCTN